MQLKELHITDTDVIVTYVHRTATFNIRFDNSASSKGYNVEAAYLGNLCKDLFNWPFNDTFSRIVSEHPYIHSIFMYMNGVTKHFSKNL